MPDEVLLVKRGEGCECNSLMLLHGLWRVGVLIECPHGSKIEVLPALVVECDWCGGIGAWIGLNGNPDPANPCEHCLGTGLRLAKKDEPNA